VLISAFVFYLNKKHFVSKTLLYLSSSDEGISKNKSFVDRGDRSRGCDCRRYLE
jgi:hypothetical protein